MKKTVIALCSLAFIFSANALGSDTCSGTAYSVELQNGAEIENGVKFWITQYGSGLASRVEKATYCESQDNTSVKALHVAGCYTSPDDPKKCNSGASICGDIDIIPVDSTGASIPSCSQTVASKNSKDVCSFLPSAVTCTTADDTIAVSIN